MLFLSPPANMRPCPLGCVIKGELQPDYRAVAERTSQQSLAVRTTQTLHARFLFPANDEPKSCVVNPVLHVHVML